ncbi:MAG: alpha/beta fold hydrolase [Polyangiaceae bacterium]|nr:alpha/beta fold hydrolase [Polyangiaceae bacterium]
MSTHGRPLLFLHGFTGTPRCYRELLSRLPGVVALVPALRGHAGHDEPGPPEPFEQEVARLAECVRTEVAERVHLVGYSLGARLGLGLVLRRPDLIASATLVGLQPGLPSRAARERRARQDDEWVRLLEQRGIEAFVAAWERQPLFASQAMLAAEVREAQRTERLSHHPGGLAWALRSLGTARMPSYWNELPRVRTPVHLMAGQLDAKFTQLGSRAACTLRCRMTVVQGAGHNLVLERPDAVASAILQGRVA